MDRERSWLSLLVAVLGPIFWLLTCALFLLMNRAFLRVEYLWRPGFPTAEEQGFQSEAARLRYADQCLAYVKSFGEGVRLDLLADEDGDPLFTWQELLHMRDVRAVVRGAVLVWGGVTLALAVIGVAGCGRRCWGRGLVWGGRGLLLAVVGLGVGIAVNFDWVFDQFHRIFFEDGTWTFAAEQALIRLFPLIFWEDAMLYLAVLGAVGGGIAWWVGARWRRG